MGAAFASCNELWDHTAADETYHDLMAAADSQEAVEKLAKELSIVRVYSAHYQNKYRSDRQNGLRTEVEFESDLLGRGFLDGVLDGPPRIGVEQKLFSSQSWTKNDEYLLALDPQVTAYFSAMREIGEPLDSMQYRVQIKPGINRRFHKSPETAEQYEERLQEYLNDKPELFKSYDVYRSDQQMDDFLAQVEYDSALADLVRSTVESRGLDALPIRKDACRAYGGCSFTDLCRKEPNAMSKYRHKPERSELSLRERNVLEVLSEALVHDVPCADLAKQCGLPYDAVSETLGKLLARGLVTNQKPGAATLWSVKGMAR